MTDGAAGKDVYNCISWSGGVTTQWYWPPYDNNPWYDPDPVKAFDNYYSNKRSNGSSAPRFSDPTNPPMNYEPTTYASQSSVDVWKNNFVGEWTHGSVRKPGNNHAHGYNFESKPGNTTRTLHPRHALVDESFWGYGHVERYYKINTASMAKMSSGSAPAPGDLGGSDIEAIRKGYSVLPEPVALNTEKVQKLKLVVDGLGFDAKENLSLKYRDWKQTWSRPEIAKHSNPKMYAISDEYRAFLDLCREHGKKAWAFLFLKLNDGDWLASNALEDLIMPDFRPELRRIVDKRTNQLDKEGRFIIFSTENVWKEFAAEMTDSQL